MEVTVKTLDSQTKTLQIPSEITVKEFKKRIAEEMGIPIEKQRLIFQGKVLQDDKPLQEYRVDGCVVHLVEKQPPRSTRTNGQSTETTTSSTSSTTSQGNMFMGAFALPMDVMGVTQQIVQGIVQQIGAESAQANISTSSSDDGSSVNVHINLSTVLARNDARSRLGPARVHLRNVANIVNRLQNDGMLPSNSMDEDTGSSQNSSSQGEAEDNSESTSTPEDLANVLQEVVRLNDEIRPHLQRYQELLRASSRQLRPGDDSLPDLTAEALHSLSHAYHALSDVTTNFHVPDPQLNVLPSVTPIPPSIAHAHARTTPATSQSQATSSQPDTRTTVQTSSTTTSSTGGTCGTGGTSGTSGGMLSGSGILSGGGLLSGSGLLNANPNFTASSSASVPTTSTGSGSRSRPNNPPQFLGFPLNLRNLPNLAVQFNPSAGNITIAHIMTTAAVDEASLRATTTTTNSTPTPRTSSRGSDPIPAGIGTTTGSNVPPGAEPMDDSTSDQSTSSTPSTSTSSSNPNNQSESRRTNGSNTVLNFPRQNIAHRDPLLPCQSFHFASLNQQFNARTATSQSSSVTRETTRESTVEQQPEQQEIQQQETQAESEQTQQQQQQQQQQQKQQREQRQQEQQQQQQQQSQEQKLESNEQQGQAQAQQEPPPHRPIPMFNPEDVPDVEMLRRLLNVGQRAAADAAARTPGGLDPSEFSQFSVPPSSTFQRVGPVRDRSNDIVVDFARRIAERDRNMTPEQQALRRSAAIRTAAQNTDTLSRLMNRLSSTFPMRQVMLLVVGGTVEPYTMTRAVTREFLREDLLDGAEATPANLQRATEKILEELHETFNGAFTQCKVKDGIDAPATLLTYLRPRIRRILEVVNSSESDADYAAEMAQTLSRGSVELLGLTEYCLQDGIVGLESALRTSLRNSLALAELEPELREMAIDTTWTCVRDLRNSMRVRDSTLLPYVVRKEKRDSGAKKRKESPKPERKEVKKDEIPETGAASSTPLTNNTTSESHEVAMETDEKWKKVIPAEWVPVISQDIIRQRRLPRQAPFSDAYINGMPSKRRKVMEPKEPAPYNQCMSATLKRSIAKAGVTPKTDLEKVNKEANSSPLLEKVFEQEVKNEVRERLSNDTDYNSERFPSIHNYFEKDKR